jgi:hypothetical protein
LAKELSRRVRGAIRFHDAVQSAVSDLRDAGHDLWSFDEDDDFEVWGPDNARPSGPGVVITFAVDGPTTVSWSSEIGERGRSEYACALA